MLFNSLIFFNNNPSRNTLIINTEICEKKQNKDRKDTSNKILLVANTKSLDLYHGKHENCYAAGERFYAHLNVKSDKCARLALTNTCASHKLFLYRKPFSVKTICRWELIIALFSSLSFSFTLFLEFSFICSSFLCLIFLSCCLFLFHFSSSPFSSLAFENCLFIKSTRKETFNNLTLR